MFQGDTIEKLMDLTAGIKPKSGAAEPDWPAKEAPQGTVTEDGDLMWIMFLTDDCDFSGSRHYSKTALIGQCYACGKDANAKPDNAGG